MMGEKQTQASPLAEIPSIAEIIKLLSTNAFRPPRARLGLFTPHAHFSPSHTDKEPNTAPPQARITHWAQPSRALRYLIFLHATSLPSWAQVLSLRPRRVSPPAIIHSPIYSAPPWAQVLSPPSGRVSPPAIIHSLIYSAPPWAQVLSPCSGRVSPPAIIHSLIYSAPPWAQVLSPLSRRVSPPAIIQFSHLLSKYPRGLFCALGFVARYLTPDYASRPSKSSGPAGSTLATGLSRHASGMVGRAGTSTHWAACPSTQLSKGGHTVLRWVNCQMGRPHSQGSGESRGEDRRSGANTAVMTTR